MSVEDYFYSSLPAEEIESNIVGAVVWNRHIELTPDQRAIARENIGAGQENRNFTILGYFSTLEEMRASLSSPPVTGDAYGIGPGMTYTAVSASELEPTYTEVTPASGANPSELGFYEIVNNVYVLSEDTSVDPGKTYYTATFPNPSQLGYYIFSAGSYVLTTDIMVMPGSTYYEYEYDEDIGDYVYTQVDISRPNPQELGLYVNIGGVYVLTEDVVPMTAVVYYEYVVDPMTGGAFVPYTIVEPNPHDLGLYVFVAGSYMSTADTVPVPGTTYYTHLFVPYDIYVWDGNRGEWVNNGPLSTAADIIDDGANDVYHVLSSRKTRELADQVAALNINTNRLVDNAVTASKILDGSVSTVYYATIGTVWYGKYTTQLLSPDGVSADFTITSKPPIIVSIEVTYSGDFLVEGTDFTYTPSTGVIHLSEVPELGNEIYRVTYPTNNPPYKHTISIPGMRATDHPIVDINPDEDYATADAQLDRWPEFYKMVAEDDALIVYAHHTTNVSVPIQIICVRK